MADIYFYKLTNDDGSAPCVFEDVLSLAICKPKIRKAAGRQDWLFGFGAQRLGERLIYVAEVTDKQYQGDYYRRHEFSDRPDRIYEWRGEMLRWRSEARFHPADKWAHKDIGQYPRYDRAYVLLSSNFRYFGRNASDEWKERYAALRERVEALGQGERVHHSESVRAELLALRDWIWSTYLGESVLGQPNDREGRICKLDEDEDQDE